MKIAVRYQSRGNNTKTVAEAIAKAAGTTAESIEKPLVEPVDILFIGGGVYMGGFDASLETFIEHLNPELVKSAAVFTSAGGQDKTKKILSILENRGLNVRKETLLIKFGLRNHARLGGKGFVTLTQKHIRLITEFVHNMVS